MLVGAVVLVDQVTVGVVVPVVLIVLVVRSIVVVVRQGSGSERY